MSDETLVKDLPDEEKQQILKEFSDLKLSGQPMTMTENEIKTKIAEAKNAKQKNTNTSKTASVKQTKNKTKKSDVSSIANNSIDNFEEALVKCPRCYKSMTSTEKECPECGLQIRS